MRVTIDQAREVLAGASGRVVIYADFDGDGLSAAAVLVRGLRVRGVEPVVRVKQRSTPAWSPEAAQALIDLRPDFLVVADLGVREEGLVPGVPTLYIDHHIPSGIPTDASVLLGHDLDPVPCTAWLAYEVVRPWLPQDDPALWVAGVGVLSDLGDKAPWPHLSTLRDRYYITHVRKVVTLCNASRRATRPLPEVALQLLCDASVPRQLHASEPLEAARREVQAELKKARGQRPLFAADGPWVHVPTHSTCQVHPLIAQQWAQRLPKYIALATNDAYLPDAVAFSIRTRREDADLPAFLRSLPFAADHPYTFGHGHRAASGGQLPPSVMQTFLRAVGIEAIAGS